MVWQADGNRLGSAAGHLLWEPVRGRHDLVMLDGSGGALDNARFHLKGTEARASHDGP